MITSLKQAVDEMGAMLKTAWEGDPRTLNIPIVWPNVASDTHGDTDDFGNPTPYLQVELLHEDGQKTSLRGAGGSRHQYTGSLMAFLHVQEGRGQTEALPLIQVAVEAFSGVASPSGVWFRNPHHSTIGPQGVWYVMAMTVTFVYDLIL